MFDLNNREIAGLVWYIFAFVTSFSTFFLLPQIKREEIRKWIMVIVSTIVKINILLPLGLFFAYVVGLSWFGIYLRLWNIDQITTTIVWCFVSAFPLFSFVFKFYNKEKGKEFFCEYTKDAIKLMTLVEFICVFRNFDLLAELLIIPIIYSLALINVMSDRNLKLSKINNLTRWLLAFVYLFIFWNSISHIEAAPGKFFTINSLRDFIFPIYLTIGSMPFFYVLYCYSCFETALLPINLHGHSEEVRRYAKKRFFWTFFLRPWLLSRAKRQFCIIEPREYVDIDNIIRDVLQYEKEEKNPPIVDERSGWSPHDAREFLTDKELRTGDYHRNPDYEDWWSGVVHSELGGGNTANYSFSGIPGLVKKLKLYGHFIDKTVSDDVLIKFTEIAIDLCERAIGGDINYISENLTNRKDFNVDIGAVTVSFTHEKFPSKIGFNLTLEVEKRAAE